MSELLDKQVNAQKEFEKLLGSTQAPASPWKRCAMKMKVETNSNNDGTYTCKLPAVLKSVSRLMCILMV